MTCDDARHHSADYLTGALPGGVREALEEHLDACPECARDLASLPELWTRLGELPEPVADSAAMRARFRAMTAGHGGGAEATRRVRDVGAWWWTSAIRPAWAVGATAAALVAGVVVGRYSPAAAPVAAADVTALRAEVGELRQMVSLSLLQGPSASDRLKGVAWAADLDGSGTTVVGALLETLANDPNVNVRLASVDALRRFAERDAVRRGAVEALGRQTSPIVQMALIDFVVEARLTAAKDALSRLATDQAVHETVRARAARGLREVS
jgi:anti-sigma factor RsiW